MKEFVLRALPVDLIEIPSYAKARKNILKRNIKDFDERLFIDVLAVSFRDGIYRILHDPHILEVMKKNGIKKSQCQVYLKLTEKEERSFYLHSGIHSQISKREMSKIKKIIAMNKNKIIYE